MLRFYVLKKNTYRRNENEVRLLNKNYKFIIKI